MCGPFSSSGSAGCWLLWPQRKTPEFPTNALPRSIRLRNRSTAARLSAAWRRPHARFQNRRQSGSQRARCDERRGGLPFASLITARPALGHWPVGASYVRARRSGVWIEQLENQATSDELVSKHMRVEHIAAFQPGSADALADYRNTRSAVRRVEGAMSLPAGRCRRPVGS